LDCFVAFIHGRQIIPEDGAAVCRSGGSHEFRGMVISLRLKNSAIFPETTTTGIVGVAEIQIVDDYE